MATRHWTNKTAVTPPADLILDVRLCLPNTERIQASSWDGLHARYETHRVNHSIQFMDNGVCTNQAESYFSRLRRAEWGYLNAYAGEMAWREDHRRTANGELFMLTAAAAAGHPVSRRWKGYWQRERIFSSIFPIFDLILKNNQRGNRGGRR